MTNHITMDN